MENINKIYSNAAVDRDLVARSVSPEGLEELMLALSTAIEADDDHRCRRFIRYGVPIDDLRWDGLTALGYSVHVRAYRCLATFLSRTEAPNSLDDLNGQTVLHIASAMNDPTAIDLLFCARCDPNWRDRDGWTPLHVAALMRRPESVVSLVERGADRSALTSQGKTALEIAMSKGFTEIVDLLKS